MRGRDMENMMDVVVPLRGVEIGLVPLPRQTARDIVLVFQDEVDGPGDPRTNAHGEFVKQIWPRIILDGVDGVETKPVEMKLLNPIFGVLDEEVAHRPRVGSVELDRIAPGRFVSAGEEIGRVEGQEIPLGTEVVVNDVQQHCDPAFVRGLDESPEVVRSSVACVRSVKKGSVIAPVPAALEVADRHDLDGRHPEVREVVQLKSSAGKRALRRKSADMEFVKHHVVPFAACPGLAPAICAWVYGLARTVHVVGLKARRRIRNELAARQSEPVTRAR